jgi:hypothetical protein
MRVRRMGFPHSDIFGSKVARHLPEAYRRHAASFIASSSLGIHHMLLDSRQEIQTPQYIIAFLQCITYQQVIHQDLVPIGSWMLP